MKIFIDENSSVEKNFFEKDIRKKVEKRYNLYIESNTTFGANNSDFNLNDKQKIYSDDSIIKENDLLQELFDLGIKIPKKSDFNYHYEINNGNIDCFEFGEFLPQEVQYFTVGYIEPIETKETKVFNDFQYEPRELVKQNFNIYFYDIENIYTTRSILQQDSGKNHKDTILLSNKKYTNSGWTYSYESSQGIDSIVYGGKYIKNK